MKLILLGDLHYPTLTDATPEDLQLRRNIYEGLFQALDAEQADACITLGDMTNSGVPEDLAAIQTFAKGMTAPLYAVAGNHDTHGCSRAELFGQLGTTPYYRVELPQARLLFLDTTLESCVEDWLGVLDTDQYQWLKGQVGTADKPVFIVAHHPVKETTRRSDERRLQLHADIWPILSQQAHGVWLNGHNHYHSIAAQQGWLFVQTGDFPSHMDYRVLELEGNHLTITTRSLRHLLPPIDPLTPRMQRYTLYHDLVYEEQALQAQLDF